MKRSYPTNVDGQIFYIDEDAFELLQNYLHQLKMTFPGEEGNEIVADIESRIREHFAERTANGANVIVLADVNKVIETMGTPEVLGSANADSADAQAREEADSDAEDARPGQAHEAPRIHKKLFRNMKNKVFGGIFGGLAEYMGWNANAMRILFVILVIVLNHYIPFWTFLIAYIVGWMVIPAAVTPRQILQMKGDPVNTGTVGQVVMENSRVTPPPIDGNGSHFFTTFFSLLGKCVVGFIGLLAALFTFCMLLFFLVYLGGCVALALHNPTVLDTMLGNHFGLATAAYAAIGVGSLLITVLAGLFTWACASVVLPLPKTSKSVKITIAIIVMVLIIAFACLFPALVV